MDTFVRDWCAEKANLVPESTRVLIVEGDASLRRQIALVARKLGFQTDVATQGNAAIQILRDTIKNTAERQYELVLIGNQISDMGHSDFLKEIAGLGDHLHVPVKMLVKVEGVPAPAIAADVSGGIEHQLAMPLTLDQLSSGWKQVWGARKEKELQRLLDDERQKNAELGQEVTELGQEVTELRRKLEEAVHFPIVTLHHLLKNAEGQRDMGVVIREFLKALKDNTLYQSVADDVNAEFNVIDSYFSPDH